MRSASLGFRHRLVTFGVGAAATALVASLGVTAAQTDAKKSAEFTSQFNTAGCTWASTGDNPYFPLTPGLKQVYEGQEKKKGPLTHLEITVTQNTKLVDG